MKTVSLKLSEAEKKQDLGMAAPMPPKGPRYPWGTRLDLDNETLKKLGMKAASFEVGAEMSIVGRAEVTSISSNTDSDGKERSSVTLQIVSLGVEEGSLADKLKGVIKEARGDKDDD